MMNRLNFLSEELQAELASTVELIDEIYGRQTRRFSNELASQHVFDVAELVASVSQSKTVIMASLLHDVVEDWPASKARIFYRYDDRVNELVHILTKPSIGTGESREQRNLGYWKRVAADNDALLIKLADLLSNIPNKSEPEGFRNRFILEKSQFIELVRDATSKSNATKDLFSRAEQALATLSAETR